jgi:hypothetical protein
MSDSQKWSPDKIHRLQVPIDQSFITLVSIKYGSCSMLLILCCLHWNIVMVVKCQILWKWSWLYARALRYAQRSVTLHSPDIEGILRFAVQRTAVAVGCPHFFVLAEMPQTR